MKVVIVESPNKIKKIGDILGSGFKIVASMGHFRDLPRNNMAVDINNGFTPKYTITKRKVVKDLRSSCSGASCVYIATDPDREGEGIAIHIIQVLNLRYPKYRRMVFREITPDAVRKALVDANNDGRLNQKMADAYQARRVIDRIVGYTVSPCLWRHVQGAKSAGRVQSVATRVIADRERLIENMSDQNDKYHISGVFEALPKNERFEAKLNKIINTHEEALSVLEMCKTEFTIGETKSKIVWHSPPPAFKTSVYQQHASNRYGLSPKQSMSVAQKLFEKGLITYHRTDITTLSEYFSDKAREYVEIKYGSEYLADNSKRSLPNTNKTKEDNGDNGDNGDNKNNGVQAAHEAIRPTDVNKVSLSGSPDIEKKVYRMIWVRAIASLMAREKCRRYTANIIFDKTRTFWFVASHMITLFKGFKILTESKYDTKETKSIIPDLKKGDSVRYYKIESRQISEYLKRYTESSLVKDLENKGIGRPSTFASIVETIQARKYVRKKNDSPVKKNCMIDVLYEEKITSKSVITEYGDRKKRLFLTDLGKRTTNFLTDNLNTLLNYDFTSDMENNLDNVANGDMSWQDAVGLVHETMSKNISSIAPVTTEQKAERKQRRNNRVIGEFEDKKIEFFITRYGPAVIHDNKWFNLDDQYDDVSKVTLDIAISAIRAKRDKNKGIIENKCKIDNKDGLLKVLKGPYGYYMKFFPTEGRSTKKDNYFLPKDIRDDLECISAMTLDEKLEAVRKVQQYRESKRF